MGNLVGCANGGSALGFRVSPVPQAPWLVLPPQAFEQQEGSDGGAGGGDYYRMGLLDLATSTCVPVAVPVPREGEEVSNWSLIGSSHGWLIFGNPNNNSMWLFNPFYYVNTNTLRHDPSSSSSNSNFIIRLPDPATIDSRPPKLPTRVFLSSPPPSQSHSQPSSAQHPPLHSRLVNSTCKVFALYDKVTAFCTLKTDSTPSSPLEWKLLRPFPTSSALHRDAFFLGHLLLTMSSFSSSSDEDTIVQSWFFGFWLPLDEPCLCHTGRYIIQRFMNRSQVALRYERLCRPKVYLSVWSPSGKCAADLRSLFVIRYVAPHYTDDGNPDVYVFDGDHEEHRNKPPHKTLTFEVYSYNPEIKRLERLNSLGNHALFLGDNQSFALPILDDGVPFRSNCIYFTDDYGGHSSVGVGHDCGVFDMVDETIGPLHHFDFANLHPHPMWILPSTPAAMTSP